MRPFPRILLAGLMIAAITAAGLLVLSDPERDRSAPGTRSARARVRPVAPASGTRSDPRIPGFSDNYIDDSGHFLALSYSAPVVDRSDLSLCYASPRGRSERGISDILSRIDRLAAVRPRPPDYDHRRAMLQTFIATLHMYEGRFVEASSWFGKAMSENPEIAREERANLLALRGIAALRRGEIENCVACLGPSSCILPIAPEAVHQRTEGSREAIRWFTEYLDQRPDDLGARWLLNIASMTLGEYPGKVPAAYLIPTDAFRSRHEAGRFVNIAQGVGLGSRGPNMLGGSAFDDFNGDGRPDIMVLSGDWDLGGSLFINRGDGSFEDRGGLSHLADQKMAVNLVHADYDNDGDLDVLALRGGWETPYRLSLLRNRGDGVFDDVTVAAGLGEPIASQSAGWGDYDNDGLLDLYVAGEYHDRNATALNHCRLYHNRGDGTFQNVAATAGVLNERWAKGVAWGDYDDDGDQDLYVSNMNGPNRLYRNQGDGTFADVAPELGLTGPEDSFSCWFWDYDNDGRLDLFVTGFNATLGDVVADQLGRPARGERPRLYHNLGPSGFREVAAEVGLDRVTLPMGSNFGDIDNDGFLDVFLATGRPPYSMLIPDLMFRNVDGRRFEDVTIASGTGHLQKGHGVSFADWDDDGDIDLFVEVGGQTPGDRAHNVLFQNPGNDHHWIKLRLVGTRTNRSAIGARIRLDLEESDGSSRRIDRVVGTGSSFGGNSLVVSVGLRRARAIRSVTVDWPTSKTRQTFRDLGMDRVYEIVENSSLHATALPPLKRAER
ncbi:MAG: FG-GAP-like repeat-containing protein [Isosphaeraceae bacterium]